MKTKELQPSYALWLAARSRNALRRKIFASLVAGGVFVVVLLGLIMMPRQVAVEAPVGLGEERPDTSFVVKQVVDSREALDRYDSLLVDARASAVRAASNRSHTIDTVSPELRQERIALMALLDELTVAMEKAAASPLPAAFRAIATTQALIGDPRAKVLRDSLDQVEKLREPFSALGAGDPIYVSLTAHLNELGRSLRDIATDHRAELRARIAPLMPIPVPPSIIHDRLDTMSIIVARGSSLQDYEIAMQVLTDMRTRNAQIDSIIRARRIVANSDAPPLARITVAIVVALFAGFGIVLLIELRNPRVSNRKEAESVSGLRVLAVINPVVKLVDRDRRMSDAQLPPLVDIVSDRYRVLYLHLTANDAKFQAVVVTGAESNIVTTVATNIAATAAYEASSTLLVDADINHRGVSSLLRIPDSKTRGLNGLLDHTLNWTQAVVPVAIGRDREMDVLIGRSEKSASITSADIERVRGLLMKMQERYDLTVVAAPLSYVQQASNTIIPTRDVILCVHIGQTPLSEIRDAVLSLQGIGRRVQGLVVWDDEAPSFQWNE